MSNLKKVALIIGILISGVALASYWDTAWLVSGSEECSYPYCRCTYEVGDFKFNVMMKENYCPSSIKINVETNQWKKY